ncbi:MAG: single-stranded DNA-binding protein [Sandaracinaceae bacterium]
MLLVGAIDGPPTLRRVRGGSSVLRFRVRTDEAREGGARRVGWHTVVVWGRRAEGLGVLLSKGQRVAVEGRLVHRRYRDREGRPGAASEVQARLVRRLGPPGQRTSGDEAGPTAPPDAEAVRSPSAA